MSIRNLFLLALSVWLYAPANAQEKPADVARQWWKAYALGDTAYLRTHSIKDASFTLSVGKFFSGEALFAQASKHTPAAKISFEWTGEAVQYLDSKTAVARLRVIEGIGNNIVPFQYLSVLKFSDTSWKVVAAQSTKELTLSARKPELETANLQDYAGSYKTPSGAFLKIIVRENKLIMIEPSGAETLIEPIGPGLYELSSLPFVGNVRFAFSRDASGKVTHLSRIGNTTASFPRLE